MPDIPNENSAEYKKQLSSHKKNIGKAAVKNEEVDLSEKKEEKKEEKKFCKLCQKPETREECSYGGKAWDRFSEPMPSMKKEEVESIEEKAPPGDKYERMVKHIKKGYSKDGGLSDKEKSIAYATAWKAKNKAK